MLIRVGHERSLQMDLMLAGWMSCIAGALNAVGFLIAGSFTANMTGNISMFVEHLADRETILALSFAGLVLTFIIGATFAALVIQTGEARGIRTIYGWVTAFEGAILLALGAAFLIGPAWAEETHLVIVLSFVMGLQNAMTTMISKARVRTTHASGMATDLGIEIAAFMGQGQDRSDALPKLKLHSLTLFSFAFGGLAGVFGYLWCSNWLFVLSGVLLIVIAMPTLLARR